MASPTDQMSDVPSPGIVAMMKLKFQNRDDDDVTDAPNPGIVAAMKAKFHSKELKKKEVCPELKPASQPSLNNGTMEERNKHPRGDIAARLDIVSSQHSESASVFRSPQQTKSESKTCRNSNVKEPQRRLSYTEGDNSKLCVIQDLKQTSSEGDINRNSALVPNGFTSSTSDLSTTTRPRLKAESPFLKKLMDHLGPTISFRNSNNKATQRARSYTDGDLSELYVVQDLKKAASECDINTEEPPDGPVLAKTDYRFQKQSQQTTQHQYQRQPSYGPLPTIKVPASEKMEPVPPPPPIALPLPTSDRSITSPRPHYDDQANGDSNSITTQRQQSYTEGDHLTLKIDLEPRQANTKTANSPGNRFDPVLNLNSPNGRGADLFAKYKKKYEPLVIDENSNKDAIAQNVAPLATGPAKPPRSPHLQQAPQPPAPPPPPLSTVSPYSHALNSAMASHRLTSSTLDQSTTTTPRLKGESPFLKKLMNHLGK